MDPALLLALLERLPDDSMTAALAAGGKHLFGWGVDRYIAADTFDALNLNTVATGQWKKKPPEIKPYPRPKAHAQTPEVAGKKRVSLRQLHAQMSLAAARQGS